MFGNKIVTAPEPFIIDVDPIVIERIISRVREFRWPAEPDDGDWQYGAPLSFMRTVQRHWLDHYDWATEQRLMNRHHHYTANIDGERIHFIHERSNDPDAIPLLLVHGWPGSFREYLDLVTPLTETGSQAFHVVVISLPGYGFSDPPPRPVSPRAVAALMARLMTEVLGYDRYMAHGGDWGSMVSGWLAFDHPQACRALHWTMMGLSPGGDAPGFTVAPVAAPETDEERDWVKRTQASGVWEFGYAGIQATKPLTLSYAMMDSPMGVAAWILEKFQGWTDRRGEIVTQLIPLDTLLTNVMIYLVTDSFGPASWMYRSLMTEGNALPKGERIEVPIGMAAAAFDVIPAPPRSYVERVGNLVYWTEIERGGHFLAMEQPETLVRDLRQFGQSVREVIKSVPEEV